MNIDGALADISLAAFGRKEIEIAEVCLVAMISPCVPKILGRMRCLVSCICEQKLVSHNTLGVSIDNPTYNSMGRRSHSRGHGLLAAFICKSIRYMT